MREILFRGKAKTITPTYEPEGTWVYGFYSDFDDRAVIERKQDDCFVDKNTVGQFTGLTDKNGKKIFEGDILENEKGYIFGGQYKCVVKYEQGYFYAENEVVELSPKDFSSCEVIGNIHDNFDLLKKN